MCRYAGFYLLSTSMINFAIDKQEFTINKEFQVQALAQPKSNMVMSISDSGMSLKYHGPTTHHHKPTTFKLDTASPWAHVRAKNHCRVCRFWKDTRVGCKFGSGTAWWCLCMWPLRAPLFLQDLSQ